MVPAEGIGIFMPTENTQVIDFSRRQNAEHGKIAPNWNVPGTRDFTFSSQFVEFSRTKKDLKPDE